MKLFGLDIKLTRKQKSPPVPLQSRRTGLFRRSYDAAVKNRHTENHWLYATAADADSLIRADLPTLRNRARYEVRNNCYAAGIVDSLVTELVGTGPTLQMQTGSPELDKTIENLFALWAESCDKQGRLNFYDIIALVVARQQVESGEGLIVLTSTKPAKGWSYKPGPLLRLQVVEPDRLQTPLGHVPTGLIPGEKFRDGIEFDEDGKPLKYYILKQHPGSAFNLGAYGEYDTVPAAAVIHLYKQQRPGQSRGVPWMTPALPLFAQLRRYTLATLSAAEQAANISGTIEAEGQTEEDDIEELDEIEIPRNSLLTLPIGRKMAQLKPEHPSTNYDMFKDQVIAEMARCLSIPFNVAAGTSAKYNYASGRLDKQNFYKFIKAVRGWAELHACNRIFRAWWREASLIPGYIKGLPANIKDSDIEPKWNWPGQEHVDPWKEAKAQAIRLENNTTTLAIEYANQGRDWEKEIEQRVKELEKLKDLGIISEQEKRENMEGLARMARAGVTISDAEARRHIGLAGKVPGNGDKVLRRADQELSQFMVENGMLTINEVRQSIGLPTVKWGNARVQKTGVKRTDMNDEGDIK